MWALDFSYTDTYGIEYTYVRYLPSYEMRAIVVSSFFLLLASLR